MSEIEQPIETGLTRRDLLKKGAVLGGALAWGAPVVQVIGMRPALAQSTSPSCPNLYCVKAEAGAWTFLNCSKGQTGRERGGGNCLGLPNDQGDLSEAPESVLSAIDVDPNATCLEGTEDAVPGVKVTLPANCRLAGDDNEAGSPDAFVGGVSAAAKCGSKGGEQTCDAPAEVTTDEDGRTVLCFPLECSNGTEISHIEIIFCCS